LQRRALCLALPWVPLQRLVGSLQRQVIGTPDDLLLAFAAVAAASPPAARVPGTLIVRGGTSPGVAVVGDLDDAARQRVAKLFDQFEEAAEGLRFVGYAQAERDAEILAERLELRFTRAELDEAFFAPIPRGGLIVLGMLALTMNLRHDQLRAPAGHDAEDPPGGHDRLMVLVDDCAISGHRIHQTLQATSARRIALALLYAPDELCRNVESAEPRVQGCVAARRLRDQGPELLGSGYERWTEEWTERLGDTRYWIGRPESIAFAWKEPDRSFINGATGEREIGWQLLPSGLSPPREGSAPGRLQVQHQPEPIGPLHPAAGVFFAEIDNAVVVAHAGHDTAIELDAMAGAFWRALIEHGTIDGVVDALAEGYDVARSRLETDVTRFVDDLRGQGILAADGAPPAGSSSPASDGPAVGIR
jgi:hypothetical protein